MNKRKPLSEEEKKRVVEKAAIDAILQKKLIQAFHLGLIDAVDDDKSYAANKAKTELKHLTKELYGKEKLESWMITGSLPQDAAKIYTILCNWIEQILRKNNQK